MSLFDALKQQVTGAIAGHLGGDAGEVAAHPGLFKGVVEMIETRGVASIVEQLKKAGLSSIVGSWVGKGANLPISADQVSSAFGPEVIEKLAQKAGLPAGQVSTLLAKFLPGMVDHLTPKGLVDDPAAEPSSTPAEPE